jgi:hypothetical protein
MDTWCTITSHAILPPTVGVSNLYVCFYFVIYYSDIERERLLAERRRAQVQYSSNNSWQLSHNSFLSWAVPILCITLVCVCVCVLVAALNILQMQVMLAVIRYLLLLRRHSTLRHNPNSMYSYMMLSQSENDFSKGA